MVAEHPCVCVPNSREDKHADYALLSILQRLDRMELGPRRKLLKVVNDQMLRVLAKDYFTKRSHNSFYRRHRVNLDPHHAC